jgi:wyosine [tRNA(Phe)-imidazoG37] synthetase (radical SAM superfamily)
MGNEHNAITSIQQYLASDELQSIKDRLGAGERIPECKFCWNQEDLGMVSMRQSQATKPVTAIKEFFIEFGNTCNAACRMCHSGRSSLIGQYERKFLKGEPESELAALFSDPDFFITEKFWYKNIGESLVEYLEDLDYIQVSGGEPFINVYFDKFLDTLINSGKRLPKICITTNGSFTAEQFAKLDAFESIEIYLSTDSLTRDYYEYLRWPLTYDNLMQSIEIMENYKGTRKPRYEFQAVLQNLNLLDVKDTIRFFNERFPDDDRFNLSYTTLNTSEWYHPHNSPKWVREKVVERLEWVEFHPRIKPNKKNLVNLLNADHPKIDLQILEKHIQYTDSYRGIDTWEFLGWNLKDIS